ncbi:MAG TPA: uracil-DNA glycosylase [Alphaproteobacteria bacterium]|nr:uracil-DNA glycosylase [Alphaproteobacteria bacterium]MDP6272232.1 uracil-DNA glycosylase [Alphaproteobacteria bacterium]MDP7428065.1 uracil-DNA glycosylase [Alphaproteobacteria bacterium]HJM51083.1 uracil-DNA glycosylase [Alphaproteobacteria bacterium]
MPAVAGLAGEPHSASEPASDCPLCPRLADFRRANRQAFATWHNAPVAAFGDHRARLLVVGLAPGLRGANRSGRPFTGDAAGDLLYPALERHGLARGSYGARPDDGLELVDCRITNAVRCVPPENKPVAAEINCCRQFLRAELASLQNLRLILALGTIAHNSLLAALELKRRDHPFGHAARYQLGAGRELIASYHCSRYNVNTGRLTPRMFDAIFGGIRRALDS